MSASARRHREVPSRRPQSPRPGAAPSEADHARRGPQDARNRRNPRRERIGIGKPPSPEEGAGWVLSGFRPELVPVMDKVIETAAEAARTWVLEGFEAARQRYNGLDFGKPPRPEAEA